MSRQELEFAANSLWRNQQMSTQAVASALLNLIVRYVNSPDDNFEKQYNELVEVLEVAPHMPSCALNWHEVKPTLPCNCWKASVPK